MRRSFIRTLLLLPLMACKRAVSPSTKVYSDSGYNCGDECGDSSWTSKGGKQEETALKTAPSGTSSNKLKGFKVFLDVGHCPAFGDKGAVGVSGIWEYELNKIAVDACAERLRAQGAQVSINSSPGCKKHVASDGLQDVYSTGKAARGSHAFVSMHHNAFGNGDAQGTEVLVYAPNVTADDKLLATGVKRQLIQRIWKDENMMQTRYDRPEGGSPWTPRRMGVLKGANDAKVPKILVEAYFLTNAVVKGKERRLSKNAGIAVAEGLAEFWEKKTGGKGGLSLVGGSSQLMSGQFVAETGGEAMEIPPPRDEIDEYIRRRYATTPGH